MFVKRNNIVEGKHNKPCLVDVFYEKNNEPKPIVIFCHGYKGFKDWGAWNLMAEAFANAGFFFVKFNFSHNGGTTEQPIDFPDLEAFGNNNYTKELDDLETVIDWVLSKNDYKNQVDITNVSLIGHSRAGGIVVIKSEEDCRVKKVITIAGVSDFGSRSATIGDLEEWKNEGVKYVLNRRTHQEMPHFYQFHEDFVKNEKRLTIRRAVENLQIPHLIIHGDNDTSISINEAMIQHKWNPDSQLEIIKGANHVFGTSHPWEETKLSDHLKEVMKLSIEFINN